MRSNSIDFRLLWPIMVADFIFWNMSSGIAPLMSRAAEANTSGAFTNDLIARMVLAYTAGSLFGRWLCGRWRGEPKVVMIFANVLGILSFAAYFQPNSSLWLVGQLGHGLALGLYSISAVSLTANLIPADQHLRGFALVGVADFLGFATGPVISGFSLEFFGFEFTYWFYVSLLIAGLFFCVIAPRKRGEQEPTAANRKVPMAVYWRFLPLSAALFLTLLFNVFYSRFFPLLIDLGELPAESIFFLGYTVGGLGFRFGTLKLLQRLPGFGVFSIATTAMALATIGAVLLTHFGAPHVVPVVLLGVFFGFGFELLYVFILSWVATRTAEGIRGKIYSFVFFGFDLGKIVAGLSFGALTNWLSPKGLLAWLLILLPVYALLARMLYLQEKNDSAQSKEHEVGRQES